MGSWRFEFERASLLQDVSQRSFVGGFPNLPKEEPIPSCKLCSSTLSFFFQVAFPAGHVWHGKSLAVFACTSCVDEGSLIPEMLDQKLLGADIPDGFLERYQTNFRFVVFASETGTLRNEYQPRVAFRRLNLAPLKASSKAVSKIGGRPVWMLDDESPATYAGRHRVEFLLQIGEKAEFPTVKGAPPQIELDLTRKPTPSPRSFYQLFLGNQIYFFGVNGLPLVYVVTQI